jgi:hypothetical protein
MNYLKWKQRKELIESVYLIVGTFIFVTLTIVLLAYFS